MNMLIRPAVCADIEQLAGLYDDVNDALAAGINYPQWIKGVYPVRATATEALAAGTLYVLTLDDKIAGSIILSQQPEAIYRKAKWQRILDDHEVLIIYTLVVHPAFQKQKVATRLLEFAIEFAQKRHLQAVRLDVEVGNIPAIRLYEKSGFTYIDTFPYPLPLVNPVILQLALYEYLIDTKRPVE